ncbi:MAG: uroporphyrinogen-III synthase [Lachnospiraceae bacterium]
MAFTSPTGVRVFFEYLRGAGRDVRSLGNSKVAAIGEGTKKALAERGIYADLMPEIYDGASLGTALAEELQCGRAGVASQSCCGKQRDSGSSFGTERSAGG